MVKLQKYKRNEILEIHWLDAVSESGWKKEGEAMKEEPVECWSLGYYLKSDNESITISPDFNKDKDRSTTCIPIGMILDITRKKKR